jgi:hypothetical protein
MAIIGFNFNKIIVEKKTPFKGKISIKPKFSIKSVEEHSLGAAGKKGLKFCLEFSWKYEPNLSEIILGGEVIFLDEEKKIESIIKDWKKDKKLPKEVMTPVIKTALNKSTIKALVLSQDVALPPPIPFPKVKIGQK